MTHFVILNRTHGLLQWSGEYANAQAALADFDSNVGIDPNGEGLDVIADAYDVREVSAELRAAVEAWADAGAAADQSPL